MKIDSGYWSFVEITRFLICGNRNEILSITTDKDWWRHYSRRRPILMDDSIVIYYHKSNHGMREV